MKSYIIKNIRKRNIEIKFPSNYTNRTWFIEMKSRMESVKGNPSNKARRQIQNRSSCEHVHETERRMCLKRVREIENFYE